MPCCTSQSEGANTTALLHSTPHPGMKYGQRLGLAVQKQTDAPGVWARWSHRKQCQLTYGEADVAVVDIVSMQGGWHYRGVQQPSTKSWADKPWEKTPFGYPETAQRAWGVVWVTPLSACPGVHSCLSLNKNNLASPTSQHSLALDLEQTCPGRSLQQRQSKSQVAAQSSQFPQWQYPNTQP